MENLTWTLCVLATGWWTLLTGRLLLRPPGPERMGPPLLRRTLWLALALAALLAGAWGPRLWTGSRTDFERDVLAGAPAERVSRTLRLPFLTRESVHAVDTEQRVVQAERRVSLHVPLAFLAFLAVGSWLDGRGRGGGAGGRRAAAVLALVLLGGGCAPPGEEAPAPLLDHPRRALEDVAWDTLARVSFSFEDTLLFTADEVSSNADGFWVMDRNARRIVRFSWAGELRWTVGAEGQGPSEFGLVQDMSPDAAGNLWVLDPRNMRITGIDPDGEVVAEIRVRGDATPHAFAVRRDGSAFYLMSLAGGLQPILMHPDGSVEPGPVIPPPDVRAPAGLLSLQGRVARARESDTWVWAFSMGDRLLRFQGLDPVAAPIPYAEAVPFPHVVEQTERRGAVTNVVREIAEPVFAAAGVEVAGGEVRVRFRGRSEHAGRIIDRFDLEGGRYLGSFLLPKAGAFSAWEGRTVIVANDPLPEILVVRRR